MNNLAWGYKGVVPENSLAAWGARAIFRREGGFDLVGDRQDLVFENEQAKAVLIRALNGGLLKACNKKVRDLINEGTMRSNEAHHILLHEDAEIAVAANTNGSCGYIYLAAWLKEAPSERSEDAVQLGGSSS